MVFYGVRNPNQVIALACRDIHVVNDGRGFVQRLRFRRFLTAFLTLGGTAL